jgi:hypothetical protein
MREQATEALAFNTNQQILRLIEAHPRSSLPTIAELLGASAFLTLEDVGRGKAPVYHLDIRGFIEELKRNKTLHELAMPESVDTSINTILPPDEGEIQTGRGTGIEKKQIIPRTRYLMEVLQDLHLPYTVHGGTNTPNMMRGLSYQAFVIPSKDLMILVNNEEGNATFIVHHIDTKEEDPDNTWQYYAHTLTKDQLKSLGEDKVTTLFFNIPLDEWKGRLTEVILFGAQSTVKKDRPVSTPEGQKKELGERKTAESAIQELIEAFGEWKLVSEDTKFNVYWLVNNGYKGLYIWTRQTYGTALPDLVVQSGNTELQQAFTKQEKREAYTRKFATALLIEAFGEWKLLPENTKNKFNVNWLVNNGYDSLYVWTNQTYGTKLSDLVAQSGNTELQQAFTKKEMREEYTRESATALLVEAFERWQTLPEETRGEFNPEWLQKNGYKGLYAWTRQTYGTVLSDLVAQSGNTELQKAFTKQEKDEEYTKDSAILRLIQAFKQWELLPKETRGDFRPIWLVKNGYNGLYSWTYKKYGTPLPDLVAESGNEKLKTAFTKQEQKEEYTEQSATFFLIQAFEKWKLFSEETRGEFNPVWLKKNGYYGLYQWTQKKNSITLSELVARSGNIELQGTFKKRKHERKK